MILLMGCSKGMGITTTSMGSHMTFDRKAALMRALLHKHDSEEAALCLAESASAQNIAAVDYISAMFCCSALKMGYIRSLP